MYVAVLRIIFMIYSVLGILLRLLGDLSELFDSSLRDTASKSTSKAQSVARAAGFNVYRHVVLMITFGLTCRRLMGVGLQ